MIDCPGVQLQGVVGGFVGGTVRTFFCLVRRAGYVVCGLDGVVSCSTDTVGHGLLFDRRG